MDLSDFIKAAAASASSAPTIDPAAAVLRLEEAARRYRAADAGPRFPVGAWITPAPDASVKGAGDPHVVVATRRAEYAFGDTGCGCRSGMRLDTRVLCIMGAQLAPYWVESAEFLLWELPPDAATAPSPAPAGEGQPAQPAG